jgi:hypothetical protein
MNTNAQITPPSLNTYLFCQSFPSILALYIRASCLYLLSVYLTALRSVHVSLFPPSVLFPFSSRVMLLVLATFSDMRAWMERYPQCELPCLRLDSFDFSLDAALLVYYQIVTI